MAFDALAHLPESPDKGNHLSGWSRIILHLNSDWLRLGGYLPTKLGNGPSDGSGRFNRSLLGSYRPMRRP